MATKPTATTPIFAQNANYSLGPKIGQPTKASSIGTLATDGNVPGKDFPTTANELNQALWLITNLTDWTFQGRTDKQVSAHIAEKDSAGLLSAAKLDVGNTAASGPALLVTTNASGAAVQVEAADQRGIAINSDHTTTGNPESLWVRNDRAGINAWLADLECDGGTNSIGGIRVESQSFASVATSGVQPRDLAALNAVNTQGRAGEFIAAAGSGEPAVAVLNTSNGGVSLRAGYGGDDSSPSNEFGDAIWAEGGPGDAAGGFDAGLGVLARGGEGFDGAIDTEGGIGLWALGGLAVTEPGGVGALIQSQDTLAIACVVSHIAAAATADCLQVNSGDNVANAIRALCDGFGIGLKVEAQGGHGIQVEMTPETGSTIGAALRLEAQNDPTAVFTGDMWVEAPGSGADQLRWAGSTVRQYIPRTTQPWCMLTHFQASSVGGPATTATYVECATFSFEVQNRPPAQAVVMIKMWGTAVVNAASDDAILNTRWVDVTALDLTITGKDHDVPGSATDTVRSIDIHHIGTYTLPAGGARTFKFEFNNPNGTSADLTNCYFEVISRPDQVVP